MVCNGWPCLVLQRWPLVTSTPQRQSLTAMPRRRHSVSDKRQLGCSFNRWFRLNFNTPHYCPVWRGIHDDAIKWKHFPRYWPCVWGIHRWPVDSPCKGQWRGALMFSLICTWTNIWVNNWDAGDLRRRCTHYDITVMLAMIGGSPHQEPVVSITTCHGVIIRRTYCQFDIDHHQTATAKAMWDLLLL